MSPYQILVEYLNILPVFYLIMFLRLSFGHSQIFHTFCIMLKMKLSPSKNREFIILHVWFVEPSVWKKGLTGSVVTDFKISTKCWELVTSVREITSSRKFNDLEFRELLIGHNGTTCFCIGKLVLPVSLQWKNQSIDLISFALVFFLNSGIIIWWLFIKHRNQIIF